MVGESCLISSDPRVFKLIQGFTGIIRSNFLRGLKVSNFYDNYGHNNYLPAVNRQGRFGQADPAGWSFAEL